MGRGGRGRGRGRGVGRDGEALGGVDGNDPGWMRRDVDDEEGLGGGGGGGLWDDVAEGSGSTSKHAAGTLDLADFAAAALKFQSNTRALGLGEAGVGGSVGEDPMERLLREQVGSGEGGGGGGGLEEEEEEAVPDWASDEVSAAVEAPAAAAFNDSKRTLLLGVRTCC